MKLILSSCDFRNEKSQQCIVDNLDKPISECRLLYIPNEKAQYEDIHSKKYYLRMQEFGFLRENTIVFDYYNPTEYSNLDIDVIYISGGNTFATLNRIKESGFDKEIIRLVRSGVTYIGGSAGAHIASKNIEHVKNFDIPPKDVTDFDGLGLFDGVLVCHYTDERRSIYEELKLKSEYDVYKLADDESIVITL